MEQVERRVRRERRKHPSLCGRTTPRGCMERPRLRDWNYSLPTERKRLAEVVAMEQGPDEQLAHSARQECQNVERRTVLEWTDKISYPPPLERSRRYKDGRSRTSSQTTSGSASLEGRRKRPSTERRHGCRKLRRTSSVELCHSRMYWTERHRCKDKGGRTSSVQGLFGERQQHKDKFGGTSSEKGSGKNRCQVT